MLWLINIMGVERVVRNVRYSILLQLVGPRLVYVIDIQVVPALQLFVFAVGVGFCPLDIFYVQLVVVVPGLHCLLFSYFWLKDLGKCVLDESVASFRDLFV